jgi:hypothetical protein
VKRGRRHSTPPVRNKLTTVFYPPAFYPLHFLTYLHIYLPNYVGTYYLPSKSFLFLSFLFFSFWTVNPGCSAGFSFSYL